MNEGNSKGISPSDGEQREYEDKQPTHDNGLSCHSTRAKPVSAHYSINFSPISSIEPNMYISSTRVYRQAPSYASIFLSPQWPFITPLKKEHFARFKELDF